MTIRDVVIYPDGRLRKVCSPVPLDVIKTKEFQDLCGDLIDTMYAKDGIGLAAPQIGVNLNIFVIAWAEILGMTARSDLISCAPSSVLQADKALVLINPKIIAKSGPNVVSKEGCLSFPKIFIDVPRAKEAKLSAINVEGVPFEIEARNLLARCLLHESDHLQGQLLADFVGHLKKKMIIKKLENR